MHHGFSKRMIFLFHWPHCNLRWIPFASSHLYISVLHDVDAWCSPYMFMTINGSSIQYHTYTLHRRYVHPYSGTDDSEIQYRANDILRSVGAAASTPLCNCNYSIIFRSHFNCVLCYTVSWNLGHVIYLVVRWCYDAMMYLLRYDTCHVDMIWLLTHWGRVTHTCVGKLTIIGSDNGLSPERRQAINKTDAGILLIEPWGTNFSEI